MPSLLFVASERPKYQSAKGYEGAHGRLLDRMVRHAGMSMDDVRVVMHDQWRRGMEADADVVVLGGYEAAKAALSWSAPPSDWHGSVLPTFPLPPMSYDDYRSWLKEPPKYVVTFDIPKLHAMWDWHPLAALDWAKAGEIARGTYRAPDPDARDWVVNDPYRLHELADSPLLVFDTELSPVWMIGFANDTQVHVCDWDHRTVDPVQALLQSPDILKVAHNLQHDLAMCALRFGFEVARPYFDTYGGAHLLNTALERTLSPGLASRFTLWPYHKWLNDVDATRYNGLDNIVCYDACVEIRRQLAARKLMAVSDHDHDLLEALFAMQLEGFAVSEGERAAYEREQAEELAYAEDALIVAAEPVIRARIASFTKPHLFKRDRQCTCCGGGKVTAKHCWRCGGLPAKPEKKADYIIPGVNDIVISSEPIPKIDGEYIALIGPKKSGKPSTVAELRNALPPCSVCQATGKVEQWLRFKPGSDDHVADVLYRGLRIPPRKYKGKETTAAAQLEPLQDRHPLVRGIVAASKIRADLSTVERLRPGPDGKLHCVFDPWGTESGRVAGKEGLLQPGTNPMNVPKKARRFVVPAPGYFFLYPDLSQVEARAVAVLSGDKNLLRAFTEPVDWPGHPKHGEIDSHTIVQQMVSRWVAITRDQAKRTTYAVMYGGTGEQLAIELTKEAMQKGEGGIVSAQHGCSIVEAFFLAFPGVRRYHQAIEQEMLQTRTLKSLSGRERHWPERIVDPTTGGVYREVLKQGWAYKPQEIGATILALGIVDIHRHQRPMLTPLIHVHDACLMQAPLDRKDEAIAVANKALSRELYGMWFPSAMKCGSNWYEAS